MGPVGAKGAKAFVLFGELPRGVPWVPRMGASVFDFVCLCVVGEGFHFIQGGMIPDKWEPPSCMLGKSLFRK